MTGWRIARIDFNERRQRNVGLREHAAQKGFQIHENPIAVGVKHIMYDRQEFVISMGLWDLRFLTSPQIFLIFELYGLLLCRLNKREGWRSPGTPLGKPLVCCRRMHRDALIAHAFVWLGQRFQKMIRHRQFVAKIDPRPEDGSNFRRSGCVIYTMCGFPDDYRRKDASIACFDRTIDPKQR